MVTIHLTDAQRDTFAACGLIVIDGERRSRNFGIPLPDNSTEGVVVAPEGWRILTEPCDTCGGEGSYPDPCGPFRIACRAPDRVGGLRVVTLTATCPACGGAGSVYPAPYAPGMEGDPCDSCDQGVVTLGRFTIPALLPVIGDTTRPIEQHCFTLSPIGLMEHWPDTDRETGEAVMNSGPCDLDPLPRPGRFIARPERVEVTA